METSAGGWIETGLHFGALHCDPPHSTAIVGSYIKPLCRVAGLGQENASYNDIYHTQLHVNLGHIRKY